MMESRSHSHRQYAPHDEFRQAIHKRGYNDSDEEADQMNDLPSGNLSSQLADMHKFNKIKT